MIINATEPLFGQTPKNEVDARLLIIDSGVKDLKADVWAVKTDVGALLQTAGSRTMKHAEGV